MVRNEFIWQGLIVESCGHCSCPLGFKRGGKLLEYPILEIDRLNNRQPQQTLLTLHVSTITDHPHELNTCYLKLKMKCFYIKLVRSHKLYN